MLEVWCKLSCGFFLSRLMKKMNEMWTSWTLEIHFSVWKAVLSFEESCYYKCKMNILPLNFFSTHSSGHKNLAEQMQDHNQLGTETWGALHQMRAGFSYCGKVSTGLCASSLPFPSMIAFAQCWWLSVHLYLSQICLFPMKQKGKLLFSATV